MRIILPKMETRAALCPSDRIGSKFHLFAVAVHSMAPKVIQAKGKAKGKAKAKAKAKALAGHWVDRFEMMTRDDFCEFMRQHYGTNRIAALAYWPAILVASPHIDICPHTGCTVCAIATGREFVVHTN